ncbi:MAG: LuxR C-terminal-related transcriptional regulator [Novosphingobium sp.]|nr:LuxR C-terminal-related transcriptional regulator [Novosphingobium sp.]
MSLTSQDETDLILPLYQGAEENPHFATFLERLRRRTGADHVAIIIRRNGSLKDESTRFHAGIDLQGQASEREIGALQMLEDAQGLHLRLGRAYSVAEFVDHDPDYRARRAAAIDRLGIVDERVVRVLDEAGVSATLVLARRNPCSAADAALLSNLAPYVALAIRNLIAAERQAVAAAMTTQGLTSSGLGWILLESDARIAAIDPETRRLLAKLAGITALPGERLRDISQQAEDQLSFAALALAENSPLPTHSLVLSDEPRIEALLVPANGVPVTTLKPPAMLALCRLPRQPSPDRPDHLARLFDLPAREAELAIALSDGLSIAEAAEAMGLTLETARNYSKRLYAKLGVRGQAELVRLVYESSAVLA